MNDMLQWLLLLLRSSSTDVRGAVLRNAALLMNERRGVGRVLQRWLLSVGGLSGRRRLMGWLMLGQ